MRVRFPEDLSLVTVDDTDMRGLSFPRLTAVCQDSQQLGRAAVERLVATIKEESLSGLSPPAAWFRNQRYDRPSAIPGRTSLTERVTTPLADEGTR